VKAEAILRKKRVAQYNPFRRGTFDHAFCSMVNEQGIPDAILGEMLGLSSGYFNHWRLGRFKMNNRETIEKIAKRCGYRLALVRLEEDEG
jgi:hypothetical protein